MIFPAESGKMNILLITLDTTRADHIGCYNDNLKFTPNIDKLGNEGIIYENCYSNIPVTLPAHASMLTGKHPFIMNVRNNGWYTLGNEYETITEFLKKKNFHTFAVISSYVLASKFGLSQGFDTYDDSLDVGEMNVTQSSQIPADKVFNKFKILINKAGNKKFFGWVHFYDPHTPYSPPGKYGDKFKKDPYLGEIAYMDLYIGKITRLLKDKGLLDNTIIIIAGDHAEDKGEHQEFGHGIFCYDVTLRVPLIIWNGPGLPKGKRVNSRAKLTDIYQAVKSLSGSQSGNEDHPFLLSSAKRLTNDNRDLYFESLYAKEHMGWSPLTGIISNEFKYISLPEPELYDLKNDPGETENLFSRKKNIAEMLDKKLSLFYSKKSGINTSGKRELSKSDREHLSSLGYISSFKKSSKKIDPKAGIKYLARLRDIRADVSRGKIASAEKELKKLFFSRDRIDTIHAYEVFDALYRKKGDKNNLLKFRELAVKDFPESQEFTDLLANSYFAEHRFNDAERVCEDILHRNERNTQAIIMLGKIQVKTGNFSEALFMFNKAEKIEPMNFSIKRNIALVLRMMKRNPEAIIILDKISGNKEFRNNQDNIKLLSDISMQLLNTGAGAKALSLLKELISLHPDDPSVYTSYGHILSKMRKHSEAL
ncbi:MAG: sulfatase-like hydrolase/transferase, partial [Candidatus Aminicenantes bacterium]|nr:sulfatase-like hydrolase/transferase [Candidatus Aminicenantes bacterium]